MSDRTINIIGFAVIGALTLAAIIVSWLRPAKLARITETLDHLTARRSVRVAAVLIWAWVGWHFLAR
jgi:hypothetical protein